jgi:hypothetical protein
LLSEPEREELRRGDQPALRIGDRHDLTLNPRQRLLNRPHSD